MQVFLNQRSNFFHLVVALLIIFLLGLLDEVTGFEISFSLFYVLPVAYLAWFVGRRAGILISVISATVWLISNHLAGQKFSNDAIPYWNTAVRLIFFLIIMYLLTSLRQSLEREKLLSRTDYLTGTWNLLSLYEKADDEIKRLQRYGKPVTIIHFDVDNFKKVNDQFGHAEGDEVLRTVVSTLKNNLRVTDTIARIGGDEFVILLPETDSTAAKIVAKKMRQMLLDVVLQKTWPVTFSIGVATYLIPPDSVEEFIKTADQLMYHAKQNGKNKIEYSTYSLTD